LADKPPVLRKFWSINPRCFCILADKPTVLNPNFFPPLVWTYPATASVRCTSPPRAPVTSESLETVLQSGGSCQENKRILVKIHSQRKRDPTSGQKKNQTEDKSVFPNQSGDPERLRLVSKVELILSNGDLVSDLPHPRVTLKRPISPDIP